MRDRSGWRRISLCASSLCLVAALASAAGAEMHAKTGERSFQSKIDLLVAPAGLGEARPGQQLAILPKFRTFSFLQLRDVEVIFAGRIETYPVAATAERTGEGPYRAALSVMPRITMRGPGVRKQLRFVRSFQCREEDKLSASERCRIETEAGPMLVHSVLSPEEVDAYAGTGRIAVDIRLDARVSDGSVNATLADVELGPVRLMGDLQILYRYDLKGTREEALEKLARPAVRNQLTPAEAKRLRHSLGAGG